MNFTPKTKLDPLVCWILTIAVAGLVGWGSHVASMPCTAKPNTLAAAEPFQVNGHVPIIRAVEVIAEPGFQTPRSGYYQPVSSWYKSKHWWKRNAPIVGGAGGGALVGGLVGGGTGAIIGGAVGGGGGYLYKRSKRHEYHHRNYYHHK